MTGPEFQEWLRLHVPRELKASVRGSEAMLFLSRTSKEETFSLHECSRADCYAVLEAVGRHNYVELAEAYPNALFCFCVDNRDRSIALIRWAKDGEPS